MDRLLFYVAVIWGAASYSYVGTSGSVLKTVKAGDNITLYCDCQISTGVFIMWYRNCSHENQPSLIIRTKFEHGFYSGVKDFLNPVPRLHFVKNQSSESYDLLIQNITGSEEGLYYCGTEQQNVEDKDKITHGRIYSYGNVTRIMINSSVQVSNHHETCVDCGMCWILLFSLCPTFAVLSSLFSFLLGHHCCLKKAEQVDEKIANSRHQTRGNQDEDVCYAALEIRTPSQRLRKKKTQSSDFSTYSAIRTSRI
ncbi:uncharacterized protein LOC117816398 [Notolabrus celidotus]|uniref:uncharacterized protein LOC117816398 n=1 Tax=Notolabrus celidotus TaxID=1203425 RepID=UPI00148FB994|nr:uncharacterized protein LOC117816398 [Notolabrus celidotus]